MATKLLVVDDSELIRATVAHAFRAYDCEILEARDGVQGLATAERHKPDIILLDVSMPVMDGIEMLRRVKSHHDLRAIPLIMLTMEASRETVTRIAKLGVQDYILKPFEEDQIVARVERVTSLRPRPGMVKVQKRYDDPLTLLVVDDKPAIHEQIVAGLADTNWKVEGQALVQVAWRRIKREPPDVVFVSTLLPGRAGFWLLDTLQKDLETRILPVFALSVKADHALAQKFGVAGIITKPIDPREIKTKVIRALNLDLSSRYFAEHKDVLVVNLGRSFETVNAEDIAEHLEPKLTDAVNSGIDKLAIDLTGLELLDISVVQLCIGIHQYASELSVVTGVIASDRVRHTFTDYAETKNWIIKESLESVLEDLKSAAHPGRGVRKIVQNVRTS